MSAPIIARWQTLFDSRALPILPSTRDEVRELIRRSDSITAGEIQHSLLHDPLACLRVIRAANKAKPRSFFDSEIASIESAVAVLGVPPLLTQVSRLVAVDEWPSEDPRLRLRLHMQISRMFHAAYQARDFAILSRDLKSEEVFLAALLHDAVEMLLWLFAPKVAARLGRARARGQGLEGERQALGGVTLDELRLGLAGLWQLPSTIASAMDRRHYELPRNRFVQHALAIARLTEKGWYHEELATIYQALSDTLRLPADEVGRIVEYNAVVSGRAWWRFGVEPAARWLPLLPGPWWPDEFPEDDEAAAPADAREPVKMVRPPAKARPEETWTEVRRRKEHPPAPAPVPAASNPIPKPAEEDPAHEPEHLRRYRQVMEEIGHHLDGSLDMHDMMTLIMRGMRDGIGLKRVVFALLSPDHTQLRGKYVVGATTESPLRRFQVAMDGPHLLRRILAKPQALWLNAATRPSLGPHLPQGLKALTGDADFFAMSVFVRDKPVGIFYADNGGKPLSEFAYQEFKQLCLRAAQGLGHLAGGA